MTLLVDEDAKRFLGLAPYGAENMGDAAFHEACCSRHGLERFMRAVREQRAYEQQRRGITLRELANLAVDSASPAAAIRLADALRSRGLTYACTLAFVQRSRPAVTQAEWDALLYQGEQADD